MLKSLLGKRDKEFYKQLFSLALPIAFQNLIFTLLNMTDNLMIGQFGDSSIAGVGAANRLFFLFNLFIFGVNSGAAIFVSQYWGIKDVKNIRRVLGFAMTLSVIGALPFTLGAVLIPEQIVQVFNSDPEVIEAGALYLRVIGLSYGVTAISFSYGFALRGIGKATLPMTTSIISVFINIGLNAVLIFGLLGFPQLGVLGAAIATLIARLIEVVVLLVLVYVKKTPLAAKIIELFDWNKELIKKVTMKLLPVVLNEIAWSVGVTIYSIVYGRLGTEQFAAITILGTIEQLGMVLFFGMGNACAVMLGNALGSNELDKAWEYSKKIVLLSAIISVVIGAALVGFAPLYLQLYNVEQVVIDYVLGCIVIYAVVMPFKVFNTINIVGILRSGGDTFFTLFLDGIGVWGVGVPLAWLGYFIGLDLYGVYILVMCEEVFKLFFGFYRYRSKKWVKNLVS